MRLSIHNRRRGGGKSERKGDFARGPFGRGGFDDFAGGGFGGRGFGGPGFGDPRGQGSQREHGRGRPDGMRRGGGRRGRLFDQSELQTLLLSLLADQPRHGYDLIKEIESLSGGAYAPSPGIVYPALTFMEEQGVIAEVEAAGSRKAYAASDEGRRRLEERAESVATLRQRLEALAQVRERTDPAPVRRAMHSMKTALFDRLSQEGVKRDTVLAIAEIIDEAARKIERIEA